VGPDLSVPGWPEVFAIGDIAVDPSAPLAQVAQPAIQGGHHVARQIERRLGGLPTEPFRYRDKGSMATIGRHDAVAEFPNGRRLHGVVGWVAWLGLHLVYLMGFRNRANVLVNWAWNYLTYDRASRMIAPPIVRSDDAT
jgi:NADH:ubiquinone reductase (H+-translocating)